MTDPLSYEKHGAGPGLVLVHGTSSTGRGSWGTVLDRLAAEYTVVLPDLPGSGDSPLPDTPLDIDTVADQIAATARAAGLDRFVVGGASLGAPVAVKTAARHPGLVRGLVTVVGYARLRTTLRLNLEMWQSLHARGSEETGAFLAALTFSEEYLEGLTEEALQQIVQGFGASAHAGTAAQIAFTLGIDVRDDLGAVRAPALVLSASGDRFVSPEHSAELARGIAGAHLVETPGGHASIVEHTPQVERAILDFLTLTSVQE